MSKDRREASLHAAKSCRCKIGTHAIAIQDNPTTLTVAGEDAYLTVDLGAGQREHQVSLYGDLFRYRERADRKPLEDFLGEALKHLLERLSKTDAEVTAEFILKVLLGERRRTNGAAAVKSFNALRERLGSARALIWDTQRPIKFDGQTRRPDISLFDSSGRVLAIESKVGAGLRENQLEHYGGGLAEENRGISDLPCALVFLSHATAVPSDFTNDQATSSYHVPLRASCSWTDLYEWFRTVGAKHKLNAFTGGLITEFTDFLKEKHMDTIDRSDLGALREFLSRGTQPKLEPLFRRTREVVEPHVSRKRYEYLREQIDPFAYSDGAVVWDWCYHDKAKKKPRRWWIAWGLLPGGRQTFFDIELPDEGSLRAFIAVGWDPKNERLPIDLLRDTTKGRLEQKGWIFDESQMQAINTKDVSELCRAPSGFTEAFARWIEETFPDADGLLDECLDLVKAKSSTNARLAQSDRK